MTGKLPEMVELTRELLDTGQATPLAVLTYTETDDGTRHAFAALLSLPCQPSEEPAILAKLAGWLTGVAATVEGRARWLADQGIGPQPEPGPHLVAFEDLTAGIGPQPEHGDDDGGEAP